MQIESKQALPDASDSWGHEGDPDLRWSQAGACTVPGWCVAWAQIIGTHHPAVSQDSVGHRFVPYGLPLRVGSAETSGAPGLAPFVALADGVGGGACAEVASRALVAHCLAVPDSVWQTDVGLAQYMQRAEQVVQTALAAVTDQAGAATLAAAWVSPEGHAKVLRVGDARAYAYCRTNGAKAGEVRQLTVDQNYSYTGEAPPPGIRRSDPARMVGTDFIGELEFFLHTVGPNHALMLSSDGLHQWVAKQDIAQEFDAVPHPCTGASPEHFEAALQRCARRLCARAWFGGSDDDISVVLLWNTGVAIGLEPMPQDRTGGEVSPE